MPSMVERSVLKADKGARALLADAHALRKAGKLREAEQRCIAVLKTEKTNIAALTLLAMLREQQGHYDDALRLLTRSLDIDQNQVVALNGLGRVLRRLNRHEKAIEAYDRAIRLKPDDADAFYNRGNAKRDLHRGDAALTDYEKAIAIQPDFPAAHFNKALMLQAENRLDEALRSYERAIAIRPDYLEAHHNRGNVLMHLGWHDEALRSYDEAIRLNPNSPDAYRTRGIALTELGECETAVSSFDKALQLRPGDAALHHSRFLALMKLQRFDLALASLDKTIALDPQYPYALGLGMELRQRICAWAGLDDMRSALLARIEQGERAATPFSLLVIDSSSAVRRRCAELYAGDRFSSQAVPPMRRKPHTHDRIRVAYISADFRAHAMATLAAGVFEEHDRSRFETCAISFGVNDRSPVRKRLENAFDAFIDVRQKDDREIAEELRAREIDIAVDLMGYTEGCRTGIFAHRAAPIQVNYLGFAGTLGTSYFDYLIADRIVVPEAERDGYAEKIVYLPDTYLCNDDKRRIAERVPSRQDAGLPAEGFVFCSFNGTFKITPALFDVWMRLLADVDGSVLWLLESNGVVAENLRREALARGIAPERLVFAPIVPHAEHLARLRLADLFLDTLPCCAHTTASDALWAGLPLLTCLGSVFSSRVAASLLNAIGLPELVTPTLADYEAFALRLARNPAALAEIRTRLGRNRGTYPLFDTARFTRHLEAAYVQMVERGRSGSAPESFSVDPIDDIRGTRQ